MLSLTNQVLGQIQIENQVKTANYSIKELVRFKIRNQISISVQEKVKNCHRYRVLYQVFYPVEDQIWYQLYKLIRNEVLGQQGAVFDQISDS